VVETASEDSGGKLDEKARRKIDKLLEDAGWAVVQDRDYFDPRVSRGIAVREYPLETGSIDYPPFVGRGGHGCHRSPPGGESEMRASRLYLPRLMNGVVVW